MMKRIAVIVFFLVCHAMTSGAIAQKHYGSIEGLRGVDGFYILIENIPEDFETMGLPQRVLQAGIEQRLKEAGIVVLSEASASSDNYASHLYVDLSGLVAENGEIVYNAMLRINQSVIPAHNRSIIINGGIWFLSKVGVAPKEGAVQTLQARVAELVDAFIADYVAVNPR